MPQHRAIRRSITNQLNTGAAGGHLENMLVDETDSVIGLSGVDKTGKPVIFRISINLERSVSSNGGHEIFSRQIFVSRPLHLVTDSRAVTNAVIEMANSNSARIPMLLA